MEMDRTGPWPPVRGPLALEPKRRAKEDEIQSKKDPEPDEVVDLGVSVEVFLGGVSWVRTKAPRVMTRRAKRHSGANNERLMT